MSKNSIKQIKDNIIKTNLVKMNHLNNLKKKELLDLEEKINFYLQNKTIDYCSFNMAGNIITLNDEQYNVVIDEINMNTRIIACAGSGKTTTIICRIKYLIDNGIQPENILLTTFNVDAAVNMKNKIISLFGFLPNLTIGTFDNISCGYYYKYFRKNYCVGISEYSSELLNYLKSENGHNIYNNIKYLFFDEFQDCNDIQFDIIKYLNSKGTFINVIGDDAQNIYQWRGSNIDYILNLDKYIPNLRTHKLINNYRSTPEIIEMANCSIKHNVDQIPKDMIANNDTILVKPEIKKYDNEIKQALYIIKKILDYIELGTSLDEMAIISRNNYSLKIMEEYLEKFNKGPVKIPYIALISEDNLDNKPKIIKDHITLTSIHKSKGLEWSVVFLTSLNDDKFPSEIDNISIQEERRLFYVAITRAKKYLHMSFTGKYISRFIAEIPPDNFKFINFDSNYFDFENSRCIKYINDVTSLLNMIEPKDIEQMRELGIIPDFIPKINIVHKSHKYDEEINKYYLQTDYGIFIDKYISRYIGQKNKKSNGIEDRTTKNIICSLCINSVLRSTYNRYQPNFCVKIYQISSKTPRSKYIKILDRNSSDPAYIRKIDFKDAKNIEELVRLILSKSLKSNINPENINLLPYNYLPKEFINKMEQSYINYKNSEKDNFNIINDIYNVSLSETISNGRRRLVYKDVLNSFTNNTALFEDINNHIDNIIDHELVCKKIICSREFDIVGELDLLDITENKIIDYKCSVTSECKLEWILQLLTYASLIKLNYKNIVIDYLEVYNPLLGTSSIVDISKWDKEYLLLQKLHSIRDRNLDNKSPKTIL